MLLAVDGISQSLRLHTVSGKMACQMIVIQASSRLLVFRTLGMFQSHPHRFICLLVSSHAQWSCTVVMPDHHDMQRAPVVMQGSTTWIIRHHLLPLQS